MHLSENSRLVPYQGSICWPCFWQDGCGEVAKARSLSAHPGKSAGGRSRRQLEQIKAGLAWHYKQYGKAQQLVDLSLYGEAEEFAKVNGMGLWRDPAPVAPWDSGARNVRYQLQMKRARARLLEPGDKSEPGCGTFLDVLRAAFADPKLTHFARLAECLGPDKDN